MNRLPAEAVLPARKDLSLKVYAFFFLFGLLTPFGGTFGKAIGIGLTVIVAVRLVQLAVVRRQHTYDFMLALGLFGAGELYFRDFVVKGSIGYLLVEYGVMLVGLLSLPVLLRLLRAPRIQLRLLPLVYFCAWAVMSLGYSLDPVKGRWFLSLYLSGLVAILLVLNGPDRRAKEGLLDGIVVGAVLVFGVALSYYLVTPEAFLATTDYRFGHYFTSSVQIGTILAMGGLAWFVRYYQPGWFRTTAALVPIGLLAGSAFTLTRTSALAVFAGLLILLTWRQSPKRIIRAALVLGAVAASVVLLTLSYQSVYATERFTDQQAGSERIGIWLVASDVFADSPFVGYGVGSWTTIYPTYSYRRVEALPYISDAHNLFVQALVETGILGTTGLVLFIAILFARAIRAKNPVPLSLVLFVTIVAMTANIKLLAPFLLLGTSLLYTFQAVKSGQPPR